MSMWSTHPPPACRVVHRTARGQRDDRDHRVVAVVGERGRSPDDVLRLGDGLVVAPNHHQVEGAVGVGEVAGGNVPGLHGERARPLDHREGPPPVGRHRRPRTEHECDSGQYRVGQLLGGLHRRLPVPGIVAGERTAIPACTPARCRRAINAGSSTARRCSSTRASTAAARDPERAVAAGGAELALGAELDLFLDGGTAATRPPCAVLTPAGHYALGVTRRPHLRRLRPAIEPDRSQINRARASRRGALRAPRGRGAAAAAAEGPAVAR